MQLWSRRSFSCSGCSYRQFSNWLPGKEFVPVPLKQLDLHEEYSARLDEAITANLPVLGKKYGLKSDLASIKRRLLDDRFSELPAVRKSRLMASKLPGASTAVYSRLLRALYKPEMNTAKVLEALSQMPGAAQQKQALYMDSVHFEHLVEESLSRRHLCAIVLPLAEVAGLPTTARERAQFLLHQHASGEPWRDNFAKFWPTFAASKDIGAWNMLLELSYTTRCAETWQKVQSHLPSTDRFTFMLRLKYDAHFRVNAAREVLVEFRERGFVVDVVVLTLFLNGLLRSRLQDNVTMAESARDHILRTFNGTQVIKRNENQLARTLKALDAVNSTVGRRYDVPLAADSQLLETFVNHYISVRRHDAAIDSLGSMAKNGYFTRHPVFRLLNSNLDRYSLERLFYLCCDLDMEHSGFMSESLANQFVRAMCEHGESYERAQGIVARNRLTGKNSELFQSLV